MAQVRADDAAVKKYVLKMQDPSWIAAYDRILCKNCSNTRKMLTMKPLEFYWIYMNQIMIAVVLGMKSLVQSKMSDTALAQVYDNKWIHKDMHRA